MPTWKKALVVNVGGVIGIAISLFIVPAQTSLWLWAIVAVAVLTVLNFVFLVWRRKDRNDPQRKPSRSTVVICLGCIVLLVDLVLRYLHH
ncbi:MAG TPA: hypothetical protein VGS27_33990 [Candidatus Sulfotelmatobacter sp.]|nr:hypothetical protein [Candidatus Sulfotelmatobacter sp.]HEV2469924.1 hypothetical protein [Candidatus Sulfotelmatobacter sp.]